MLHLFRKLPSFSAVAAGQTANVQVPKGPTYRQLILTYKKAGVDATEAQMAADLTKIRLKINGVTRLEASAADLISLAKYRGFTIDAGQLPVFLAWPTARTPIQEENLAWGTQNVDTFNVEVDIAAGAGAVTLEASAWVTAEPRPLGPIIQVSTLFFAATASGTFEISTLPKGNGDLVALHLASAQITAVEVQVDSGNYLDGLTPALRSSYKWTGRVPQTNFQHYEPVWLDRYDDRIPLINKQDFRLKLTMGAADTVRIVMETMAAPLGVA